LVPFLLASVTQRFTLQCFTHLNLALYKLC